MNNIITVKEGKGFNVSFYLKNTITGHKIEDVGKREKYIRNLMNKRLMG